jgi:phosphatidylserine synthase
MLDAALRPAKDRALDPLVRGPIGRISPLALSIASLGAALAAATAAWQQLPALAVALWLISRVADGLDGAVARSRGTADDLGGLTDVVADTVGYAAIPIGVAAGLATTSGWVVVAVLLATFYVNAVSWTYTAAILEKRAHRSTRDTVTSVVMPRGLVEGAETIVFFLIALAWPAGATAVLAVMAAAVAVTVVERLRWARGVVA